VDSTKPASRSTRRCFDTVGCDIRSRRSISPTDCRDESRRLNIARRFGSAMTSNTDSTCLIYSPEHMPVKVYSRLEPGQLLRCTIPDVDKGSPARPQAGGIDCVRRQRPEAGTLRPTPAETPCSSPIARTTRTVGQDSSSGAYSWPPWGVCQVSWAETSARGRFIAVPLRLALANRDDPVTPRSRPPGARKPCAPRRRRPPRGPPRSAGAGCTSPRAPRGRARRS
jgi:hypothetical protein